MQPILSNKMWSFGFDIRISHPGKVKHQMSLSGVQEIILVINLLYYLRVNKSDYRDGQGGL